MPTAPGFRPSTSALHFSNGFPPLALLSIPTPFGDIDIGDASMGMCGGMVFVARDFFEAGLLPPATTNPPSSENDPLYIYLDNRFFASFNLPGGVTRYYALMDPALPDHETELSKLGLAPHGRAWIMINEEWPKIKADIDSGHPSPIGLVLIKSLNPVDLGNNHVVLVYGYDLNGTDLTMHIYDPNIPDDDTITMSLSIADPDSTTPVTYWPQPTINCFFHLDYSSVFPPQNAAFADQNISLSLLPGESIPASVTMTNTGVTVWIPGGATPYRLGSQDPQDNTTWGLGRVDVPFPTQPGQSATFNFQAHTPTQRGLYNFQWRMVQESVMWFGDLTANLQLSVQPPKTKEKEKEKEHKEKERKEKDKDRDSYRASEQSSPSLPPVEDTAEDVGGQAFIRPDERPPVGDQALQEG